MNPLNIFRAENRDRSLVLLSVLLFVTVYFAYFPSFYASIDEHEYLRNSYLLQKGTLIEPELTKACAGKFTGQGYVSQWFIGRSLFLIPFTWLGFMAIMLSGLVIHLLNLFIFSKILKRLNFNIKYSLLYLFYPAFLWNSRTLNSELLALTGLLAGLYFYLSEEKKGYILSGIMMGLAFVARYDSILIWAPFFLILLIKNRQKLLCMLLGILPVMIFIFSFNQVFYGDIISTGYGDPFSLIRNIGQNPLFFQNLFKYILTLSLAYPLMIFSVFFNRLKIRWELILGTVLYILFYLQYSYTVQFPLFSFTLFTGQLRYMIPLIGIMLISYIPLYEKIIKKIRIPEKPAFLVIAAVLFLGSVFASSVHADFLNSRHAVFGQVYSNTEKGSLLIGSSDDCNYVLNDVFEERYYLDAGEEALWEYTEKYDNAYILDISYSTVDYSSSRGQIVQREREEIKDFIEENKENLSLVFETQEPHDVSIYKLQK